MASVTFSLKLLQMNTHCCLLNKYFQLVTSLRTAFATMTAAMLQKFGRIRWCGKMAIIVFHRQLSFKFHWGPVPDRCGWMSSAIKSMQKWSNLFRLFRWLLLPLYLWLWRIWLFHQQGWLYIFRWEPLVFKWWNLCWQSGKIWLYLSSRKNR